MIRQQAGDVLEINFENGWYYVVVLTKIVMLGGNIVFAYHNDGKKMRVEELRKLKEGFIFASIRCMSKNKDLSCGSKNLIEWMIFLEPNT